MPSRPNDFGPAARDAERDAASEGCLAALLQDELWRANPVLIGIGLPSDKRLLAKAQSMAERKRHGAATGGRAAELVFSRRPTMPCDRVQGGAASCWPSLR